MATSNLSNSDISRFPETLVNSRFYLELLLDGSQTPVDGYFMECSGFMTTQEVIEICEVTPQKWGNAGTSPGQVVRTKMPGNISYTNMTLRRGLTVSMTLWNWLESIHTGNWASKRRDGSLTIYNHGSQPQFRFEFKRAWPVSYSITDMKSDGNEIEIEELEVAVESLKRVKIV